MTATKSLLVNHARFVFFGRLQSSCEVPNQPETIARNARTIVQGFEVVKTFLQDSLQENAFSKPGTGRLDRAIQTLWLKCKKGHPVRDDSTAFPRREIRAQPFPREPGARALALIIFFDPDAARNRFRLQRTLRGELAKSSVHS